MCVPMWRLQVGYAAGWCEVCGELVGDVALAQEVLVGDVALAQQQYHTSIHRTHTHVDRAGCAALSCMRKTYSIVE